MLKTRLATDIIVAIMEGSSYETALHMTCHFLYELHCERHHLVTFSIRKRLASLFPRDYQRVLPPSRYIALKQDSYLGISYQWGWADTRFLTCYDIFLPGFPLKYYTFRNLSEGEKDAHCHSLIRLIRRIYAKKDS